jgi:hypothetical protein
MVDERERWHPLHVRGTDKEQAWDVPVEGVPPWLANTLVDWIALYFVRAYRRNASPNASALRLIELRLRVPLTTLPHAAQGWNNLQVLYGKPGGEELLLDSVDLALAHLNEDTFDAPKLLGLNLDMAGSAWTLSFDGKSLVRRVPPQAQDAARQVVEKGGRPGALLASAWTHAYGRNPNAGVAYHELVRAVEAAVCPVVIPQTTVGTLGKAIAALRDAPGKYVTDFAPEAAGGDPLLVVRQLMSLVWTGQLDRHGNADESVPLSVTQVQAEAALHAAVTLISWFQRGVVRLA